MGKHTNFLLTFVANSQLYKIAIRVDINKLSENCFIYWKAIKNRKTITELLPQHIQTLGPLVDVEQIFDVVEEPLN